MKRVNSWICFLFLTAWAVVISGCSSDDDENKSIRLPNASEREQSFNASDVSGSFSFVATASWTATIAEVPTARDANHSPGWISLNKYSGEAGEHTLNITLTPNNTGKTRTATITVNSGSEEIVVSVTQKNTNESGGEEGGDSGEEYEWVDYKEMFIIDDGQDYMLSPTGHYIYFKEPGFFQGGKGGEGQRMYLLDCGEMSWKDLSIMKKPAWDKETWVGEVVPCKKGHGYFSAITYRGNLDDSRLARFWVKDYVMKGTEIVGAEIKYHDRDYDDLIYMRKGESKKYNIGHTSSSPRNSQLYIRYYNSTKTIQKWDGGAYETYLYDAGSKSSYQEFLDARAPSYNEDTWTQEEIPCVKGHAYYAHGFYTLNGERTGDVSLSSFYVFDYLYENGEQVGVIARSPNLPD
ncbi:BACON domain-containing protein [Bacteroides bouchesdurhonensis]|uniref:BACON domain-containing protein n=1 Tax=Bacteroides bouchesdurhonensis TaxID=1841855 RepID=UPI0013564CB5|nr:BACON domain-containing protein [Bacteroides bouchesdurhonensis]